MATKNYSQTSLLVTSELERPSLDDRQYRVITLANKLEALLIHDPEIDRASASLNVNVGSYADPRDLFGLAHFCEHLLFMGTEKYPSENEYSRYLSEHSGESNAYTSSDETNYFFEVAHEHFEGALDRFAQFFIAPLFSPDCKDREIRAVDSENKKNLQSDIWRLYQLDRSLSNPLHPYNKFSTGNLTTLDIEPKSRGVDVREELLKFYEAHYSANLMKLVVIGRGSLDTLQQWVESKFSAIRNIDRPKPQYEGIPLTPRELKKLIKAVPVKDSRNLLLTFPVPDQYPYYSSKPGQYHSHLLGHEGPGSLLHLLKNKEWAISLSVGSEHVVHGTDFFVIDVELTEKGLANYEQVLVHVFEYLKLIQKTGPQKWIFDEMKDISAADFKFMQKSGASRTTSRLSSVMQRPYLPRERLLSLSLIRDYEPKLIEQFADYLNPDNFRVLLTSQSFEGLDKQEKWYGTQYSVADISENLLEQLRNVNLNTSLHIPAKNEFIATDFEVHKKEVTEALKYPHLIKRNSQIQVWHKKDDTFWTPKAEVRVIFKNPLTHSTPANSVKTSIFIELISDQLVEFAYDAEVAGLRYDVSTANGGFEIAVSGYNHKLLILLDRILKKIMSLEIDPGRFHVLKERAQRSYKNFGYSVPYQQIGLFGHFLLNENTWHIDDKSKELDNLGVADLKAIIPEILRQFQIEVLGVGNITKEEVLYVADMIADIVHPQDLAPSQKVAGRSFWLPQGSSFYYDVNIKDQENINSCIDYYLQVGRIADRRTRCTLEILAQIGSEPAFNQLRTKEQLGYVVFSGTKVARTTTGYRVLIQSERTTDYLEGRIDNFLRVLGVLIERLSEEEYQAHVEALVAKKLEKRKNLREEASRYWSHITSGFYDFLKHEEDAKVIRDIPKTEVLELFSTYISPDSTKRSKLVIHLKSQSPPVLPLEAVLGSTIVNVALGRKVAFDAVEVHEFAKECQGKSVDEVLGRPLEDRLASKGLSPEQINEFKADVSAEINVHISGKSKYPEGVAVENVFVFKSQLGLTEAPTPVVDLSAYVENEPKL